MTVLHFVDPRGPQPTTDWDVAPAACGAVVSLATGARRLEEVTCRRCKRTRVYRDAEAPAPEAS